MPRINAERLLADLRALRRFGATGHGVVRTSLSEPDVAARAWLLGRMREAGLDAHIDGVGNVIGRSLNPGKALLMGSHTDTQPKGGWLDGAMGVIYALEIARALAEDRETRGLAVDVASWVDEEGSYTICLGSRSFCGQIGEETIGVARNAAGHGLKEALQAVGYDTAPRDRIDAGRYLGYFEAHIEQGGHLEATRNRIGVVTAIVGIRTFRVEFKGVQNHAGTTPMPIRKDAGLALIRLAYAVNEAFRKLAGERTVWTIGRVSFDPGAQSIIPGRAEMSLQFRDPELARLDAFEAAFRELVERANCEGPVEIAVTTMGAPIAPTPMDERLMAHVAAAAEAHAPGKWLRMPSGAGHDAMIIAKEIPSAMMFVPSIGGVSHDFAEDTAEDDIALGCQVAATAAASLLKAHN